MGKTQGLDSSPRSARVAQLEAGITPQALIERAQALRPLLQAQQDESDNRGYYSDEIHRAIKEAGLYRIVQPKMFGGWEFDIPTLLKISLEISRGHPSSGWCFTLAASHALLAGSHFSAEAQAELFGDGHFAAPHKAIPSGTFTRVDGGYRVSGTWTYASGIPVSTHFFGGGILPPENGGPPRAINFIVPRKSLTILKDWGGPEFSLGMQGSGSNGVKLEDVFVPDRHLMPASVLLVSDPDGKGTFGTALHDNPMYLGIVGGAYHATFSAILTGTARAALDEFGQIIRKRPAMPTGGGGTRLDDPMTQQTYGKALQLTDSAEELTMACGRIYMEQCNRWKKTGKPIGVEDTLRLWGVAQEACQLAIRATTMLFNASGATATGPGKKMGRYFRDIQMYIVHPSSQPVIANTIAQTALGVQMNQFNFVTDKGDKNKTT